MGVLTVTISRFLTLSFRLISLKFYSFPSCNELRKSEVLTLTLYFWPNVNNLWSDQQLSLKHKQIPSLYIRTSDLKILIGPELQTSNQLSHVQYKQTFPIATAKPDTAIKSTSPKTIVLSSLLGSQWLGKRRLVRVLTLIQHLAWVWDGGDFRSYGVTIRRRPSLKELNSILPGSCTVADFQITCVVSVIQFRLLFAVL